MALTPVTVTAQFRYPNPDGGTLPATGHVEFLLTHAVQDGAGNVIIPATRLAADLDATGSIEIELVATDDPSTQPEGVGWDVIERIDGAAVRSYTIQLSHLAPAINLADVAPSSPRAIYTYATQADFLAHEAKTEDVHGFDDTAEAQVVLDHAPADLGQLLELIYPLYVGLTPSTSWVDLGTHASIQAQATALGKTINALTFFDGLVFIGYGDPQTNTGPIELLRFNPADGTIASEGQFATEATWHFKVIDGDLWALSEDPRGASTIAAMRRSPGSAVWSAVDFAPGVAGMPAHVSDAIEFDGSLWVVGTSPALRGGLYRSTDGLVGATWELFEEDPTAGARFNFIARIDGELYVEAGRDSNLGSANGVSRVWDGEEWREGLSFLNPTRETFWKADDLRWYQHAMQQLVTVGGVEGVVYKHGQATVVPLSFHTGDRRRTIHRACRDFYVPPDSPAVWVLTMGGKILYPKDYETFHEWYSRRTAPLNATAICVDAPLGVPNIYVGTSDGHLLRSAF